MSVETYLIPVLIAIITSTATYLVTRRKLSGKIDTTEAAVLWKESQSMRKELRDEVVDLREQLKEARGEISMLRDRVAGLEARK